MIQNSNDLFVFIEFISFFVAYEIAIVPLSLFNSTIEIYMFTEFVKLIISILS